MRRLVAAPIALLTTSCAMRPWTPSVSVAYWSQDVPDSKLTAIPLASEAVTRWQLPSDDVWAKYSKMTLLASLDGAGSVAELPDVAALSVVQDASAAAVAVAQGGIADDVLLLVDLRGAASVAFASTLSKHATASISPVLTFNNWPAIDGMIPAEETLAALITYAPRLSARGSGHPVILLDAWRLAFRNDTPPDDVFDNRYAVAPHDLPDAAALRAAGISRVVYVVEDLDDTAREEDDVHDVALDWQSAGIGFFMVDLAWLRGRGATTTWHSTAQLTSQALLIEPRETILSDSSFYVRARGGFGGVHHVMGPSRGSIYFGRGGG